MRQYGYKLESKSLEVNGEITTVVLYDSIYADQRDFYVPSIPLWGRIVFDDSRLHVAGSNQLASVVLPAREMSRVASREEFQPTKVSLHAAALLLALEQQEQTQVPHPQQAPRDVVDPSLIVIPGI